MTGDRKAIRKPKKCLRSLADLMKDHCTEESDRMTWLDRNWTFESTRDEEWVRITRWDRKLSDKIEITIQHEPEEHQMNIPITPAQAWENTLKGIPEREPCPSPEKPPKPPKPPLLARFIMAIEDLFTVPPPQGILGREPGLFSEKPPLLARFIMYLEDTFTDPPPQGPRGR
jgi:hypothetical protein